MAIAYRSQASLATGSRTTSTVNMPAGVLAGDVVLVFCATGGSGLSDIAITPPASLSANPVVNRSYSDTSPAWTVNMRVWRYTVTGSGDPASFTFTHASAASEAFAIAFSGVDTTTPLDATPATNSATGTTATMTGLATVTAAAMLVGYRGSWDGTAITPPAGWTERLDQPVTWVGTQTWATPSSTGDFSIPAGNGGSYPYGTMLVALRPAGAGGTAASPADQLGLTDSTTAAAARARASGDQVGMVDGAQATIAAVRGSADAVALSDATTTSVAAARTHADVVGIGDSISAALARVVSVADDLGATDTATRAVAATRDVSDAAAATDAAVQTSGSGNAAPADTVAAADTVTVALQIARTIGDQVTAADSASGDLAVPGSADVDDPLGVSDLLVATAQALRAAADDLGLTDLVSATVGRAPSIDDGVGITDAVTVDTGAAPSAADAVGVTDAAVAVLERVVTIGDALGVTDTVAGLNPAIPEPVVHLGTYREEGYLGAVRPGFLGVHRESANIGTEESE